MNPANNILYIHDNSNALNVNFQFLFKLPIANKDYTFSLLGGPELGFLGINALAGMDLGFRLTRHHFLYLGVSLIFPLIDYANGRNDLFADTSQMLSQKINIDNVEPMGIFGINTFIGIRTQVYKRTYYYKDNEVGSSR